MSQDDPQYPKASQPGPAQPPPPQDYSPQAYTQPGYGPPTPPKTPGIAIAGLVLAFLFWPVGLVLSLIALGTTKRAGAGRGLAITGVIVSILAMVGTGLAVWGLVKVGGAVAQPALVVTQFNSSIDDADCDQFFATSTDAYRSSMGVADCAGFTELAEATVGGLDDYRVSVTGVNITDGTATVTTTESYTVTDGGETGSDPYEYTLVREGGDWKVDAVSYTGD